jgi:hypothetical protein
MASLHGDDSSEYWIGWPAKIDHGVALTLANEIFKAGNLAGWSFKNRWALNRKKPGPRILQLGRGQELRMKSGQTLTHYHARLCCRLVRLGKLEAIKGNADRALMYWAKAETEAERLYGSAVHPLVAKESARVRGVKRFGEDAGSDTRKRVKAALWQLTEPERLERGVARMIAQRLGISETQARAHVQALGYGAKNKKRGA